MVMPHAVATLCPQCGADIRLSGDRCQSCGFWLPAAPAPRTRPPTARPAPPSEGRRTLLLVLLGGGTVVLGLLTTGAMVWLRKPAAAAPAPVVSASAAPAPAAPPRPEPGKLLAEAHRKASAWHRDAVLVGLSAGPLDAHGVAPDGKVEVTFAKPSGQRISGGADTTSERLTLSGSAELSPHEERAGKARIVPDPNCVLEDAWAAAQRAGSDANGGLSLRYVWSDKQARPIWEVLNNDGQSLRRLDGVNCSILTR